MKLDQVLFEEDKEEGNGTYAGVRFDEDTVGRIKTFIEENEIPNAIPDDKIHTTLLYSRKPCPNYKATGDLNPALTGTPTEFDVWESQPDDDGNKSNCLVLQFECDDLVDRHKSLMDEHGGTFDFDEYKPHTTFSYDIGDLDIENLDPSGLGDLKIVSEYQEELNTNWAKDNSDMKE